MADSGFLTNHARVLLSLARDPGARLRDIAASVDITERRATPGHVPVSEHVLAPQAI